jgi:hypothetical protein
MKQLMVLGVVLFSWVSPAVMADCSTDRLNTSDLINLIEGNTVCAMLGTDQWQEQHRGVSSGGELWDYKKGPSDPVDPTARVGSWSTSEFRVTYTYGSNVYTYEVYGSGNLGDPHSFCGVAGDVPREIPNAYLKAGQTSCP